MKIVASNREHRCLSPAGMGEYCSTHGLPLYIGNATHIKYSFGIAHGKNDKIDSGRHYTYAFKNADELKATAVLNLSFSSLKI